MKSAITLGDMQVKGMTMLEVACRRCERRGRLSIARLIAKYGRDDQGHLAALIAKYGRDDQGHLAALIAHDCPKMQNQNRTADIYDRCGVHFPELPRWF